MSIFDPKIEDPEDQPIKYVKAPSVRGHTAEFNGKFLHKHHDGFGDPLHDWAERRLQAIEATCTECGKVELHSDHRGALKGSGARKPVAGAKTSRTHAEARTRHEEWKRYYEAGQEVPAIAALYDAVPNTVNRTLRRMGVEMRSQVPVAEPIDSERITDMVFLRSKEGGYQTFNQIGEKYGVTRERVRQLLIRAGIDMKEAVRNREKAVSIKYRPRICKWCGEPFRTIDEADRGVGESWGEHQKRLHRGRLFKQTPEERAKDVAIAADYAVGMLTDDIMAKHHCQASQIARAIERTGTPRRRPNANFLKTRVEINARKDAIATDLIAGMDRKAIAAKYNVSTAWVHLVGLQRGLVARQYTMPTTEERARWVERYRTGLNVSVVAREFGRPASTVSVYLHKVGEWRG